MRKIKIPERTESHGQTKTLGLDAVYADYSSELSKSGTVLVPRGVLFDSAELELLDAIQAALPEEEVSNGDDADGPKIYVRRVITDKPGELPTVVNRPFGDEILAIIGDSKRLAIFKYLFGSLVDYHIRRCQIHRLREGGHVGLHLDAESNPDNEFAAIVQLGRDFRGGEFVVYPNNGERQIYLPTYGSVLITTCKFRHEVWKVLGSERRSLNIFWSRHLRVNQRDQTAGCSRPGCQWCGDHLKSKVDGS